MTEEMTDEPSPTSTNGCANWWTNFTARSTKYATVKRPISASCKILLARSGLGPQQVVDAVTELLGHNLCGDQPIRLTIVPVADEASPSGPTAH